MTQKHDELLDHSYDGIREYDNPLPGWWLWLFYGTIVFAAIYIPYYFFGFGASTAEEYEQEMALARTSRPVAGTAAVATAPSPSGGGAAGAGPEQAAVAGPSLAGNAGAIASGQALFMLNCSPCHGAEGQGGIGPNLTDAYWIHGSRYEDIVNTITVGVPDKGMIAWKATLNPEKINQAAAFVLSLKGTSPPNPKAPQGDKVPD